MKKKQHVSLFLNLDLTLVQSTSQNYKIATVVLWLFEWANQIDL